MFKRMKEIKERKAEIRKTLLGGKEVDLAALKTELADLELEETELRSRQEIAEKLNNGEIEGTVVKTAEERKSFLPIEKRTEVAFEPENMSKEEIASSPEFRTAWLRRLQNADAVLTESEQRAITTVNNAAVIPTQTLNKIIDKLKQVSVIYPLVTSLNIPSAVSIPVESLVPDAAVLGEEAASTPGDVVTVPVTLGQYKIIVSTTITAAVEAMSIDSFEDFVVTQLTNKLQMLVDALIMNGSGSNQPKGILKTTTINSISTSATSGWTYDDIMSLLGAIPSPYAMNAVFVVSRTTLYGQIAKIKDDVKRPIFVPNAEDGFAGKIMGYPVIVYDAMPADTILFGNLTYYFFNWVQSISVAKDTSVGFFNGAVAYRAMGLGDGQVALADAFVIQKLKTA